MSLVPIWVYFATLSFLFFLTTFLEYLTFRYYKKKKKVYRLVFKSWPQKRKGEEIEEVEKVRRIFDRLGVTSVRQQQQNRVETILLFRIFSCTE